MKKTNLNPNEIMKNLTKITLVLLIVGTIVPEADAVFGVRRRTARRTAVVVASATHAADASAAAASSSATAQAQQQTAAAQQQTAEAQKQTAAAQQQAAAAAAPASAPAAAPAATGGKLPLGTVVSALPPGCVSTPVGGVEYYYGGGNFYRAVFQGNTLVYVTSEPK